MINLSPPRNLLGRAFLLAAHSQKKEVAADSEKEIQIISYF